MDQARLYFAFFTMSTIANVVFDDSDSENDPDFVPDERLGEMLCAFQSSKTNELKQLCELEVEPEDKGAGVDEEMDDETRAKENE